MPKIDIHPSLLFAWDIANDEACLVSSSEIEPVHFLLATLKVSDSRFKSLIEETDLTAEVVDSVLAVTARCRDALGMSDDELTTARRSLRAALRARELPVADMSQPARIGRLHRSATSRDLFQQAGRRALRADQHEVNMLHLLEELIADWPDEASTVIKVPSLAIDAEDDEWPSYIADPLRP